MVEYVEQPCGQSERGRPCHAVRLEGERQPEPDEDDPDILYGVVSEQALEVVLHQGVEHAHYGGDACKR